MAADVGRRDFSNGREVRERYTDVAAGYAAFFSLKGKRFPAYRVISIYAKLHLQCVKNTIELRQAEEKRSYMLDIPFTGILNNQPLLGPSLKPASSTELHRCCTFVTRRMQRILSHDLTVLPFILTA